MAHNRGRFSCPGEQGRWRLASSASSSTASFANASLPCKQRRQCLLEWMSKPRVQSTVDLEGNTLCLLLLERKVGLPEFRQYRWQLGFALFKLALQTFDLQKKRCLLWPSTLSVTLHECLRMQALM